jgi:hypothetical protein
MVKLPLNAKGHQFFYGDEVRVLRSDNGVGPLVIDIAYCAACGEYPEFQIAQDAVTVQEPCPYPNGITTSITLDVPSGKLVVTDDLRPTYDWDSAAFADYNTAQGQAQVVRAMAAIGCAYGPVSNSCPGLYRTGPDTYVIANPDFEEESPSLSDDTLLAGICTDLWAYSIADFEHWTSRGGTVEKLNGAETIVEVRPGTYRFTHHSGERGFDAHAPETVIFAHVERIAR